MTIQFSMFLHKFRWLFESIKFCKEHATITFLFIVCKWLREIWMNLLTKNSVEMSLTIFHYIVNPWTVGKWNKKIPKSYWHIIYWFDDIIINFHHSLGAVLQLDLIYKYYYPINLVKMFTDNSSSSRSKVKPLTENFVCIHLNVLLVIYPLNWERFRCI